MPAIELPPFTEDHRQAVRRLRFVTPNRPRTHAWGLTYDVELVRIFVPDAGMNAAERERHGASHHPHVASATHYLRSTKPDLWEWEVIFTHPDAVAFICDLAGVSHD